MSHHCHVPGCPVSTPPRLLTCPAHWRTVPADIQHEVYATVGKRGKLIDETWAPWWRAQAKAIHAAMVAEGRDRERCDRWLTKELGFAETLQARR